MAASKSKSKASNSESGRRIKSDDEIAEPFHVEGWDIDVLPVIAIFGANASGKSNVLKALNYLLKFMSEGNYDRGAELIPFKLNQQSRESPSSFKLRILFDGTIYIYSLILNSNRILSEKLEYALVSTKRYRLLYSRFWNEEHQKFEWKNGSDFSGAHIQLEKNLQEREPFTSLFSKLEIQVIDAFTLWFSASFMANALSNTMYINVMWNLSQTSNPEFSPFLERAKKLLIKFDTGLHDIQIKKSKDNEMDIEVTAFHKTEQGEILSWKFEEESTGTQSLFNLAASIEFILQGYLPLVIDELGSNLHPNIVHNIVQLFQDKQTNPKRAQLIFTSHDNTLQRNNLLRRDQIWFTQKRPDQSTELYSLSDFKVRNDLAIDKAYLDGRFGAVPFISDEDEEPTNSEEKDKDNG
ncbi:AAA family ATPase [Pseudanabaena sp. UWO311]|uniref:AAA family ATPase n=1 Tax=Pseudanabaena sp. UWO311 TaxID=2487337 RepID=UPI001CC1C5EB|nr:ATP-binding protein [Pseudanabaena sp. UWO311]